MTVKNNRYEQHEAGFTLLEILIAVAILSVGILGLINMQISSIQGNDRALELSEASTEGATNLESLMGLAYDDSGMAGGATGNTTQGNYTISWAVADNTPIPNVKQITMTVSWTADDGSTKTFTTTYYKALTI